MWRRVLVVMLVLSACSRAAAPEAMSSDAATEVTVVGGAPAQEAAPALVRVASAGSAAAAAPADAGRMIVRSAELSLQVADVRAVVQQVTAATKAADGFLGTSRLWREGDADRASMTVRVPADRLDATMAHFRGLAVRVDNESVSGQDVTRQAVDLNAQLTNLRATETELRALLVTVRQKTQRAADVLEVHTELSRVRGEIEQRTAELQTLTQMAALSTISLDLRPDVVSTPIAAAGWQPRGVLRDATRALFATGRVLVNGLIWAVVYGVPVALVFGGLVFAVARLRLLKGRRVSPVR